MDTSAGEGFILGKAQNQCIVPETGYFEEMKVYSAWAFPPMIAFMRVMVKND